MTALEERRLHAVEDGLQKLKSAIQVLCENGNHAYHGNALNIVEEIQPTLRRHTVSDESSYFCDRELVLRVLVTATGG